MCEATPAAQYDPPGFCRKRGDGQGNGGRHAESDAGREGWPSSAVPGQRIPIHIDVLVAERTAKSTMRAFLRSNACFIPNTFSTSRYRYLAAQVSRLESGCVWSQYF
jgi:hypothetical protein